jgi:hypothetical protein
LGRTKLLHNIWCNKNFLARGLENREDIRATINPATKDFGFICICSAQRNTDLGSRFRATLAAFTLRDEGSSSSEMFQPSPSPSGHDLLFFLPPFQAGAAGT